MTTRFFPASVRIIGDVGITDRTAIDAINEFMADADSGRFRLQPLDPAQFVVDALGLSVRDKKHVLDALAAHIFDLDGCEDPDADDAAAEVRQVYKRIAGEEYKTPDGTNHVHAGDGVNYALPKIAITRTGYDPKLGPKHPSNQDPTLEGFVAKGQSAQAAVDAAIAAAAAPAVKLDAPAPRRWEPPGGLDRGPRVTPKNGRKKKR